MLSALDFGITDYDQCAGGKQAAQIAIASIADAAELFLPAARVLLWYQPDPSAARSSKQGCAIAASAASPSIASRITSATSIWQAHLSIDIILTNRSHPVPPYSGVRDEIPPFLGLTHRRGNANRTELGWDAANLLSYKIGYPFNCIAVTGGSSRENPDSTIRANADLAGMSCLKTSNLCIP